MTIVDALRVAWQGTTRRRLRSVLTAASLTIGVLTLVVVQSAQSLVHGPLPDVLRSSPCRDRPIELSPRRTSRGGAIASSEAAPGSRIAVVNGYSSVNLSADGDVPVAVDLTVVDPGLIRIRPFEVVAGSWFTQPRLAPQVVLNRAAATTIASGAGGYRIRSPEGDLTVVVVGVVDDGDAAPNVFLPLTAEPALAAVGLRPVTRSLLVSAATVNQARFPALGELGGHTGEIADVARVDTVGDFDDQLATRRIFWPSPCSACSSAAWASSTSACLPCVNARGAFLRHAPAPAPRHRDHHGAGVADRRGAGVRHGRGSGVPCRAMALAHLTSCGWTHRARPRASSLGVLAGALAALAGALAPSIRAARVPIANLLR